VTRDAAGTEPTTTGPGTDCSDQDDEGAVVRARPRSPRAALMTA
jgi:hypothetical protein